MPESFDRYQDFFFDPIGRWLRSLGYTPQDFGAPQFTFFVIPLIVVAAMSGPPMVLGLLLGRWANRYELVIRRRSDPPPGPADDPPGKDGS